MNDFSEIEVDFIVMNEFSEKEGPIPRDIIGPQLFSFPFDKFALRLMSVELHINDGEKWNVWIDWTAYRVEALVIYFQLHDINARGYCRPLALAYVSFDSKKLIKYKEEFIKSLNAVSDMLIKYNEKIFANDLEQSLNDLCVVRNLQDILYSDKPLSESQQRIKDVLKSEIEKNPLFIPKPGSLDESLQDIVSMILKRNKDLDIEQKINILQMKSEHYILENLSNIKTLPELLRVKELQFKNTLYDRNLRTIEELTYPIYPNALKYLDKILNTFKHDTIILDNLSPYELNRYENPIPKTLLSIGNISILDFNFNEKKEMNKSSRVFINLDDLKDVIEDEISNNDYKNNNDDDHFIDEKPMIIHQPNEDEFENICSILWPTFNTSSRFLFRDESSSSIHSNTPSDISGISIDLSQENHSNNQETSPPMPRSHKRVHSNHIYKRKGYNLLELRSRVSFSKHLIYSLLKGRTVVIIADPIYREAVEKTIHSLKIFIPCSYHVPLHERVIPWRDQSTIPNGQTFALDFNSISTCKLIGIDRSCFIPQNLIRKVTLWDWESEVIHCPSYEKGKIIESITNHKKQWPNEITYRSHIHYILYDLALKAFIYFHEFCVNDKEYNYEQFVNETGRPSSLTFDKDFIDKISSKEKDSESNQPLNETNQFLEMYRRKEKLKREFYKRFDILENDATIVEYLSDIVKDNIIEKNSNMPKKITLDYSFIRTYKNTPQ